jgi:hypothetical protein
LKIGAVVKVVIEGVAYDDADVIKALGRRRREHVAMCA